MAEIVSMPKLGFDMAEGTLVRWVIQEGEQVAKGAVLAEIETDKATVEVESNYDGIVKKHLVPAGESVPVNKPIAVIGTENETIDLASLGLAGDKAAGGTAGKAEGAGKKADQEPGGIKPVEELEEETDGSLPSDIKASPLARRMAAEKGIDLRTVIGTGPGGRIVKVDIENYKPSAAPLPGTERSSILPSGEPAALPAAPATEQIPLNRLRAAIGRRMSEAKQQVPHFYVTGEYDMQPLLDLRKEINAMLPDEEKISVNDFIIKAVALALVEYPNLNASLVDNTIIRHGAVHMGVAVAFEGGLLTIVCRDAYRKSLRDISSDVKIMVARARDGKVRPDDIEGSTFSISNLGMYDVEHFIAIINPPEAAILAVGSARQVPVVKDGQVTIGLRMKATISVDHRISDGAEAAKFMQSLSEYLEKPLRLLI